MEEEVKLQEEMGKEAEPWEEWESKLVKWSLGIGIVALVILGALVNIFIL